LKDEQIEVRGPRETAQEAQKWVLSGVFGRKRRNGCCDRDRRESVRSAKAPTIEITNRLRMGARRMQGVSFLTRKAIRKGEKSSIRIL